MRTMLRSAVMAVSLIFILPASAADGVQTQAPLPATRVAVTTETVVKGLEHPWGFVFLPDGRILVTERPGRLRIVGTDGTLSPPISGLPPIVARGQGGLLDVALDPEFAVNRVIYLTFSEPRPADGDGASVLRARLVETGATARLDDARVIFRQEPAAPGNMHYGSRIAVAPDGRLFVTLGERYRFRDRAQTLDNHYGKVVRIDRDGAVPTDNPFIGRPGARPEIWSFGHRNPQSAAIHPATGRLWTVEHGAQGGDEINRPEPGRNYGWPVVTYGRDYSGARIGEGTAKPGIEQPLYYWDPSIAPSGMTFYTSDRIPAWKGNLFVGALVKTHLARLVLDGDRVVAEERLLTDLQERIRDVRQGPDGLLYVATDAPDGRILRILPAR
jgi:glucose/arabinose dehydrogenase